MFYLPNPRCARRGIVLLPLLLALSSVFSLHADETAPSPGEIWTKASRVYIYVGKTGLGHEHAVVGRVKAGFVHLGAQHDAGQIVFDMATFAADTAEARKYLSLEGTTPASRQKEVNDNMLGTDVLNVGKFPTATYNIASALPLGKRSEEGHELYQLQGDFTLHGVRRPLKLEIEMIQQTGGLRLRGSFAIKQTDFGIKPFSKAFGAVGVSNELTIYGEIVIEAPGATPAVAERRGPNRK